MRDKIDCPSDGMNHEASTDKQHAAIVAKLLWGVPTDATVEQRAIADRLRPKLDKMRARGYSAEHCARYAARLVRESVTREI